MGVLEIWKTFVEMSKMNYSPDFMQRGGISYGILLIWIVLPRVAAKLNAAPPPELKMTN